MVQIFYKSKNKDIFWKLNKIFLEIFKIKKIFKINLKIKNLQTKSKKSYKSSRK